MRGLSLRHVVLEHLLEVLEFCHQPFVLQKRADHSVLFGAGVFGQIRQRFRELRIFTMPPLIAQFLGRDAFELPRPEDAIVLVGVAVVHAELLGELRQRRALDRRVEFQPTEGRADERVTHPDRRRALGFDLNPSDHEVVAFQADHEPRPTHLLHLLHGGEEAVARAPHAHVVARVDRTALEELCELIDQFAFPGLHLSCLVLRSHHPRAALVATTLLLSDDWTLRPDAE